MSFQIGRPILQVLPDAADRFPVVNATLSAGSLSLHLNESPYPPSPKVQEAVIGALSQLNRYPSPHPSELIAEIADLNGVPEATVLIGPGSDDLLLTIALTFLGPQEEAILPVPSFGKYQSATMVAGGKPSLSRLDREGAVKKFVEDRYMPLGFGGPADVANAAVFLASPLAKFITGANLDLGGTLRGII